MNLVDFPSELIVNILVHLDVRSVCRMFRVHPHFSSLLNEECLWRQLCQQHLHSSGVSGSHRDYYCQHIPIVRYLWCTGRNIQVTMGGFVNHNRITLPENPYVASIPHPWVGLIYQQPGDFGVAGTATIRYEFPALISQQQASQFINQLHPGILTYELCCNNSETQSSNLLVPSNLRVQLQLTEWAHRPTESMCSSSKLESEGHHIYVEYSPTID
jgi:hypothetical protein